MTRSNSRQLALLKDACRALAAASTFQEIKSIRDRAEAVRQYARSASLGLELQNSAAEVKLRAERKAGQLLGALNLRGGDRRSQASDASLKLADLGISQIQSARWQQEAALPDERFEAYVQTAKQKGAEITTRGLLKLVRRDTAQRAACRRKPVFLGDRPAAPRGTPPPATFSSEDCLLHGQNENRHVEALQEVVNHCQLLSQILSEESTDVKSVPPLDERLIKRLVADIHQLASRMLADIQRSG